MSDKLSQMLAEIDNRRGAKIRRSGNAEAVTMPKKWLEQLGWKEGDYLVLQLNKSKGTITLQKPKLKVK